ncbi:MAG: hypothetical protein COA79_05840 [Planctomycetota bacterium]|nr:MAG: hypothetical protein COA79_05840 [Planctomycetota bacterium]
MDKKQQNEELLELIHYKMPFGKYKGRYLLDLPEPYLVWFEKQGFPTGKLGNNLRLMHEIKVNGLEQILKPILKASLRNNLKDSI